jgi:hypothetical protein
MSPPTRRSKAEREMYDDDHTLPRTSDAVQVITLDPPERIQDNPLKLEVWNYLCNDLASREILSPSYIMPITVLVNNIVQYNEYQIILEQTGPLAPVFAKDGESIVKYVPNPIFDMIKSIEKIIIKLCEKFGLNPRDAIYVTNPDIKTRKAIETTATEPRKNITYFA